MFETVTTLSFRYVRQDRNNLKKKQNNESTVNLFTFSILFERKLYCSVEIMVKKHSLQNS